MAATGNVPRTRGVIPTFDNIIYRLPDVPRTRGVILSPIRTKTSRSNVPARAGDPPGVKGEVMNVPRAGVIHAEAAAIAAAKACSRTRGGDPALTGTPGWGCVMFFARAG